MVMSQTLDRFFNAIFIFCEAVGKARAAAELSRMGKYEEAKRIVSSD